jgi:uncharacterized protein YcbK (DUF882 family)
LVLKRNGLGQPKARGLRRTGTALAAVFACLATLAPIQAGTNERTLRFFNTHTGEHVAVTYKRNGQYIPEGLRQANMVLRDWRRNEPTNMDPKLLDLVWEVYQESGSNAEIHIVSGYRAPATNAMLASQSSAVAENSQHMAGKAMDFYLPDVPLARLRALGLQLQIGGVGYYPTSGSPFIHLDTGSTRHWPRMTRQQLVAVFPEGRSLHIPSDGRPLPGYQEALAEYRAQGYVTPQSRQAATFLADLYGGPGTRVPVAPVLAEPQPETRIASAAPAPQVVPPLPPAAPRGTAAAEEPVMVAALVPPLPRPAPSELRVSAPASSDLATIQVATATPIDLNPAMAIADAEMPAMAFAAEFAGSYPDPFRILSADIPSAVASGAEAATVPVAATPADAGSFAPATTMVAAATPAAPAPAAPAPAPLPEAPRLAVASLVPSFGPSMELRPTVPPLPEPPLPGADDFEDGLAIWTAKGSTRQSEMAALSTPEVEAPMLLTSPERIYAAGFGTLANGELRTDRFSGSSVSTVSTAFVLVPNRIQLASR